MKRRNLAIFAFLFLLALPSFWRMLRPGIFSMHDFHVFRMLEFDKCIKDFQIPCRWAPDAGFGYGEPLFNFYGQMVYLPGEMVRLLGFSILDSVKFMFILSLAGSAATMFFLGKKLWKSRLAGVISAIIYLYAPYRAVDVWVRGALPEATAFVLYPAIIYFLTDYFEKEKTKSLLLFTALLALLLGIHNLSFLMFFLILLPWFVFLMLKTGKIYLWKNFLMAGLLGLGLMAFYLLPLGLEKQYISLGKTLEGYYYYRHHFVSLSQLLISRFWGYGGSVWGPNDSMSFAIGYLPVILPLVAGLILLFQKRPIGSFFLFLLVGWFSLFLTHGKSQFIWEALPFLSFIQFPWRWLTIALFSFSAASGKLVVFFSRRKRLLVAGLIVVAAVWLEGPHFREDIWFRRSDDEYFRGLPWEEQIASALADFWPVFGRSLPNSPAPNGPKIVTGQASVAFSQKRSNFAKYRILVESSAAKVALPVAYFPGWRGFLDGKTVDIYPSGELGLVTLEVPRGEYQIEARFSNTAPRVWGNFTTLVSLAGWGFLFLRFKND